MSDFWKDKDRRRGAISSAIVHLLLLLIFIFFGLTYYEPKPEEGIVINFGNSQTGMGNQADGAPQPQTSQPQPESTPQQTESPAEESVTPTQTQDVVDAPSLKESSEEQPKEEPTEPEPQQQEQPTEEVEEPVEEEPDPQPSSRLQEMLEKTETSQEGGEGEKPGAGDQGDPSGDPESNSRTGGAGGGGGGGGNYLLGGRLALNKPKPEYECAEQGRVVVKIYVDRSGTVTRAVPGEKVPDGPATTTTSSCLYDKARAAAVRTTWQGDDDAPSVQVGYIIYNFQKR